MTDKSPDPTKAAADIEYLIERYSHADNWLKFGDKRAFFLYAYPFNQLGKAGWKPILLVAKQRHGDTVMFSVDAENSDGLDFVESIHRYALVASTGAQTPDQLRRWARRFYPYYLQQQLCYPIRTLTVFPGYDDTHLNRDKPIDAQRFDGRPYAVLWESAIEISPDWMFITSFNEWHEGSEIEPSREFGDLYLNLTKKFTGRFRAG